MIFTDFVGNRLTFLDLNFFFCYLDVSLRMPDTLLEYIQLFSNERHFGTVQYFPNYQKIIIT